MSLFASRQIRIGLFVLAVAAALLPAAAMAQPDLAADYYPLPPSDPPCPRAYDSRPTGPTGAARHDPPGPLVRGVTYDVKLDDLCNLPAYADGVIINVAVLNAQSAGFLTVFQAGGTPDLSNPPKDALHFIPNANRAKEFAVFFGTGGDAGEISFLANAGPGTYDLKIDIVAFTTNTIVENDVATVDEDDPATTVDVLFNDSDPDDTLEIASVTQPANGTVVITNSGADLTYQPDPDYCNTPPGTVLDTFTYTLTLGPSATVKMTVNCENDAPVVTTTAGATAFTEGGGPVVVDSGVIVTDDNANLASATVTITNPQDGASELLNATNCGSLVLTPGANTLSITGSQSQAVYETCLQSVTYDNTSLNPDLTTRVISFIVNDGSLPSSAATKDVVMSSTANAPVVTTTAGTTAFAEDGGAVVVDSGVTVTDPDSANLASATVTITNLQDVGFEVLNATNCGSLIVAPGNPLSITGSQPLAVYETCLKSVTYNNTSQNPSTTARVIAFVANDGTVNSLPANKTVTVAAMDDAPAAVADSATVAEDSGATSIDVLANDTDVDSGTKTIASATDPANGTVVLTPVGPGPYTGLTYTPDANYCNSVSGTPDTFSYTLTPGSSSTTVSVTVTCLDDAPTAVPDSAVVAEDSGATAIDVLANDLDIDGGTKNVASATDPANGTVVLTPVGPGPYTGLTYTPDANYCNSVSGTPDTFSYTLTPGSSSTTVSVTVTCVNDGPAIDLDADDDKGTTGANFAITFTEGDAAKTIEDPVDAVITDIDSVTLSTLTVTLTNLLDPTFEVLDANVSGFPNITKSYDTTTVPGSGILTLSTVSPQPIADFVTVLRTVTYRNTDTAPDTSAPRTINFVANDGTTPSNTATATVTISAVDSPPVAVADSATVAEDSSATAIDVLANDTDTDGGPKNIASATDPANGTVVLTPVGPGPYTGLTYTPDANYCNSVSGTPDTFSYTLTPGSSSTTVSVTVTCADDAPTAVADSATVAEDSGATAIDVLANDTDSDGGPKNIASATDPANGTVVLTPVGPGPYTGLTYTPDANYCNSVSGTPDTFSYTLTPGSSSTTVSVTVTCVDDNPTAVADAATVVEDSSGNAIDVLANDTDVDGGTKNIASATDPANGTVVLTPVGPGPYTGLAYTPDANYCNSVSGSPDTFSYTLTPGSSSTTVSVTVTCVNDPPTANADAADITEEAPNVVAANTVSGNVLTNDVDVDSTLTVSAVAGGSVGSPRAGLYGSVTINSNGSFTYTLNDDNTTVNALKAGQTLVDPFGYTASDGEFSSSSTLTVTIHGAEDPPTPDADAFDFIGNTELRVDLAAAATPHALETTPTTFGVIDGDTDPEGEAITVAGIVGCGDITAPYNCSTANGGTVIMESNGRFAYLAKAGDTAATDSFQYVLRDATGLTANGTVTLTRFERVWYVDPAAGGGGDGTSASPLNALTALNGAGGAGDSDLAGDYIFIHDGTLTGSIEMEANQHLLGEGVALSFPFAINGNGSTTDLVSPGTKPQLGSGGDTVRITQAMPVEIAGLSLSSTAGSALDLTTTAALSGSGTLSIRDNELRSTTAEGMDINLNAGTTGTLVLNVTNNSGNLASMPAGNAFDISRLAGTLNLNFSGNTSLVSSTNNAVAIASNALGGINVTGFSGNSVHGNSQAGIAMSQVVLDSNLVTAGFQQVDGDNLVIGDTSNFVTGAGLTLTTVQGNLFFDILGIYAGTSGLTLSGSGGMTFAATPNVGIIRAGNGAAVDISSATINLQLDDMDSTTSGAGVSLSSVGGTFSADADASISKTSGGGTAFTVANSVSGTSVSYGGSLNVTAGAGVSLSSNAGSTIAFSGGMTLSTGANTGFSATGGGTVTVTDPAGSANNTITTTTGTALNVNGTTIGAGNLTFERISAGTSGTPVNGIVLNSTGTLGGLTVTGNGNTSLGGNDSGGIIQNTSSDAISLTSTRNVSLTNMRIQNISGGVGARGIEAVNLAGSSYFRYGTITGLGSGGGADRNGIDIRNTDTNLTLFSIENSVFSNSDSGTSFIFSSARGTSNMRLDVLNNDFSDLVALAVQSNAGDTEDTAHTVTTNITGNTFRNASPADGQGGVAVAVAEQAATHNFTISSNTFYDLIKGIAGGNSEILLAQTTGGSLNGTISGNIIGNVTAGNGDRRGIGVVAEPDVSVNGEVGSVDIVIDGNTIDRLPNREAIFVDLREDTQDSELIIRNNTIGQLAGFQGLVGGDLTKVGAQREAIDVQTRGEVSRTLNLLLSGNNVRANTSANVVNLEVNIDNATPGNLAMHATVTGNTFKNDDPAGAAELIARPRDAGAVTTLCLDMSGNTIDGGAGQIDLNETGVLNVEQASQASLATANGIPSGNVLITGTAPSFGVVCLSPPS